MVSETNPLYGTFIGVLGVVASIVLTSLGAAYGTAKSGTSIANTAPMRPDLVMKSVIPVVMAGIIGIYGLVISILLVGPIKVASEYRLYDGFLSLGAGISVGVAGLASGMAIGKVGDSGVRFSALEPRLFVGMILVLIFAEVLALYGLIVSIYLYTKFD